MSFRSWLQNSTTGLTGQACMPPSTSTCYHTSVTQQNSWSRQIPTLSLPLSGREKSKTHARSLPVDAQGIRSLFPPPERGRMREEVASRNRRPSFMPIARRIILSQSRPLEQIPIGLKRHRERSEAIQWSAQGATGLLRRPVGAPRDDGADSVRPEPALAGLHREGRR